MRINRMNLERQSVRILHLIITEQMSTKNGFCRNVAFTHIRCNNALELFVDSVDHLVTYRVLELLE